MSVRLEMLQGARLAPRLLGDSSEVVERLVGSQQNEEGRLKERWGRSDVDYSGCGLVGVRVPEGHGSTLDSEHLKVDVLEPLGVVTVWNLLATDDGGWAKDRKLEMGSTNATAADITTLRQLQMPIHGGAGEWLLERVQAEGGFLAMPNAPMPD